MRRQTLGFAQPSTLACSSGDGDVNSCGAWQSRSLISCISSVQPLGCCTPSSILGGLISFSAWSGSDRVSSILKEDDWRCGTRILGDPNRVWDPGSLSLWWRRLGTRLSSLAMAQVIGPKAMGPDVLAVCKCWGCSRVDIDQIRVQRHRYVHRFHRRWRPLFLRLSLGSILVVQVWKLDRVMSLLPSRCLRDRFRIWIWDPGGLQIWDLGQPYYYWIWDLDLWCLFLRGRLLFAKLLTFLGGFDFSVFELLRSSVRTLHWNCWVVHIGYGYVYKFHCITDHRSVSVMPLWQLVTFMFRCVYASFLLFDTFYIDQIYSLVFSNI